MKLSATAQAAGHQEKFTSIIAVVPTVVHSVATDCTIYKTTPILNMNASSCRHATDVSR